MTLPNFLVIGATKAGTTSLYWYLKAHPDVFMSEVKELNFFSEHHGDKDLGWYEAQFEGSEGARAIGEASPQYTLYPWMDVAPRVAAVLPEAKLIFIVREPAARTFSHYQVMVARGEQRGPIAKEIWKKGPGGLPPFYLSVSSYGMQVESYLRHFSREQLLIITTEDLKARRTETMDRVFEFIGVESGIEGVRFETEFNKGDRYLERVIPRRRWLDAERRIELPGYGLKRLIPMKVRDRVRPLLHREARVEVPPGLADEVRAYLREDIEQLANYLGSDFDGWGVLGSR